MKFIVSTKPTKSALDLAIINSNVSKFYSKSCLAEVSANANTLTINLEAASIVSEVKLKGSGDTDEASTVFVDSLVLKQLIASFDSPTIIFEFTESGLVLHTGKSKFTLPKMTDDSDMALARPLKVLELSNCVNVDVDSSAWKFVKDHQMFAIAMSFVHPVYTNVWVSDGDDVVVGDFDNSIFTHSHKSNLGCCCLLSDTIVNLLMSLPEGSKIVRDPESRSYIINGSTDSFDYIAQFTPKYESDPGVGSYNADMVLSMMPDSSDQAVTLDSDKISKLLNQASLLSTSSEDTITLSVRDKQAWLHDNNVNGSVDIKPSCDWDKIKEYSVEFRTALLKSAMSNYSGDISIYPCMADDDIVGGVVMKDKDVTTLLAGVE
jgi:hypothetical protein